MNQFIVAEISKNWMNGLSRSPRLLGELFESVIEHNRQRGYRLYSFRLDRKMLRVDELNETIIAVFERTDGPITAECVCRTSSCGHVASAHLGPGGECVICKKDCWR